jgi:hypothetical protein
MYLTSVFFVRPLLLSHHTVKRFANACYKGEEKVAKGVVYPKDKKSVQRREEVITSLIKVELRRF